MLELAELDDEEEDVDVEEGMGRAALTTQTISSPILAKPSFVLCLRTLTHSMRSAPELSMTY